MDMYFRCKQEKKKVFDFNVMTSEVGPRLPVFLFEQYQSALQKSR